MPLGALVAASLMGEVGDLIFTSGPFAKFIILLLFTLSVISWAVMVERGRTLRRAQAENREFWERFGRTREGAEPMSELSAWSEEHPTSPLARVFVYFARDYWPFYQQRRRSADGDRLLLGVLRRGIDRVRTECVHQQERGLGWLATLTAVAPFLGLLGTVWGIMGSFIALGRQGSATLDAVGPGIAEALITTVAGLAVAIPSVVGYNYFMRRLATQESEMERLGSLLADVIAEEELESRRSPELQEAP
jgi:biopolymer transport protein TolQ